MKYRSMKDENEQAWCVPMERRHKSLDGLRYCFYLTRDRDRVKGTKEEADKVALIQSAKWYDQKMDECHEELAERWPDEFESHGIRHYLA